MSFLIDVLLVAKEIEKEINSDINNSDMIAVKKDASVETYNTLIKNIVLKRKTEKLFLDGHYARAVEEAYKLLDNVVKQRAHLKQTGSSLMKAAFSAKEPILKINDGNSESEKNEQLGYMEIFSGCMTGIRNPRAHDADWEDTEEQALQLLVFANHLIERAQSAVIVEKKKQVNHKSGIILKQPSLRQTDN